MPGEKSDILHGTLALMILRTLDVLGPMHGYGLARRIEQVSRGVLELNQGTLYPALLTLQQAGWITSKWGLSDTGRNAKFYSIPRSGTMQEFPEVDRAGWFSLAEADGKILEGQKAILSDFEALHS